MTDTFIEISEGEARMLYNKRESVFYNKIQVFNRDISIQTIRLFASIRDEEKKAKYEKKMNRYKEKPADFDRPPMEPSYGITILDALAATGLRSVRYVKEIPGVKKVTINDLEEAAVQAASENCTSNGIDPSKVEIHHGDATIFMYQHREPNQQFDVIDLDPYGTASPFLDSAVQAVADGGLLCVTCTDMPTLAGNYPDVCFAKYGSMPLKSKFVHEMALRILLHAIDSAANKYKRYIEPWLSLSVDFYVRVFVRVFESPAEVKKSSLKRVMVYQSTQCPSFYLQQVGSVKLAKNGHSENLSGAHLDTPAVCKETGGALRIGGPFWGAPIHKQEIVDEIVRRVECGTVGTTDLPFTVPTGKRVVGVLTAISEELKDVPFYYSLPDIAATLHVRMPAPNELYSAILNAGYRVSQFHHEPSAIKTDAPAQVIWDIMRAYCKKCPPEGSAHRKESGLVVANKILANESKTNVDFTNHPSLLLPKKKATRFAPNPEENWGPKRRAGRINKIEASSSASPATYLAGAGENVYNAGVSGSQCVRSDTLLEVTTKEAVDSQSEGDRDVKRAKYS